MELINRYLRQRPKPRSSYAHWVEDAFFNAVEHNERSAEDVLRQIEEELRASMSVFEEVQIEEPEIEGDTVVLNISVRPPQPLEHVVVTCALSTDIRPP